MFKRQTPRCLVVSYGDDTTGLVRRPARTATGEERSSATRSLFGDSRRAETQGDRTATVGESFSDDAGFRPLRDCMATVVRSAT